MSDTPPAKAAKKPGKRLSAAEREAIRLAEAERARIEFEPRRPVLWRDFFSMAMRLQLLAQHREFQGLREELSWWFEDFEVDAWKQTVALDGSRGKPIGFEEFTFDLAEHYMHSMKTGLEAALEFRERQERRRREEQELRDRKNAALAKLSEADIQALNLPKSY